MASDPRRPYTLEEYLALERDSEVKYEFGDGEVYAMSGGSLAHDQIMGNVYDALRGQLRGKDCRLFTNNMQIKVPAALPYRYADGSVVCGQIEVERFNGNDLLLNPLLIYEVLSPKTEAFDRGDKFTYYKSIPAFCEYLIIAQHRAHITHYVRQADGTWSYEEANDLATSIVLPTIGCNLALIDVYADVNLSANWKQEKGD